MSLLAAAQLLNQLREQPSRVIRVVKNDDGPSLPLGLRTNNLSAQQPERSPGNGLFAPITSMAKQQVNVT